VEPKFKFTLPGQEIRQFDEALIASNAAQADDHVLAELLRLAPYTGGAYAKAILPFTTAPTVIPNGATGSIAVNNFRGIVGTRTTAIVDAGLNWNDIRSGIFARDKVGAASISLGTNASGSTKWVLVYVSATIDDNAVKLNRFAKSATTKVVTNQQIYVTYITSLALHIGAQVATPTSLASLPADTATVINIPLAFVRLPNGFGAGSTVAAGDIYEVAPFVPISKTIGAASLVPADQQNTPAGTVLSSTGFAWGTGGGVHPQGFIPPTMSGAESLLVAMNLENAAAANWTHQSTQVVDASRDWSNRVFRWFAYISRANLVFRSGPSTGDAPYADAAVTSTINTGTDAIIWGFGQSLKADGTVALDAGAPNQPIVVNLTAGSNVGNGDSPMNTGSKVGIYCDTADGNKLKMWNNGTSPHIAIFLWIDASGQFGNF
jgi:hypothetical protein